MAEGGGGGAYAITSSGTVYRLGQPAGEAPAQPPSKRSERARRASSRPGRGFSAIAEEAAAGAEAAAEGAEADRDGRAAEAAPPPPKMQPAELGRGKAKRESLAAGRGRRSSAASRPLTLADFPPLACEVFTQVFGADDAAGSPEWCLVLAHAEGKLQIQIPEAGKELLSLLDLQAWMRRAPTGHVMTLLDVVRPADGEAIAAAEAEAAAAAAAAAAQEAGRRRRVPLGALAEVNTPTNRPARGAKASASGAEAEGMSTRRRGLLSSRRARQQMDVA